jgi:hypothetical protein
MSARTKARIIGPDQAHHDLLSSMLGLAWPVYRAWARAPTPACREAQRGTDLGSRTDRGPYNSNTYIKNKRNPNNPNRQTPTSPPSCRWFLSRAAKSRRSPSLSFFPHPAPTSYLPPAQMSPPFSPSPHSPHISEQWSRRSARRRCCLSSPPPACDTAAPPLLLHDRRGGAPHLRCIRQPSPLPASAFFLLSPRTFCLSLLLPTTLGSRIPTRGGE